MGWQLTGSAQALCSLQSSLVTSTHLALFARCAPSLHAPAGYRRQKQLTTQTKRTRMQCASTSSSQSRRGSRAAATANRQQQHARAASGDKQQLWSTCPLAPCALHCKACCCNSLRRRDHRELKGISHSRSASPVASPCARVALLHSRTQKIRGFERMATTHTPGTTRMHDRGWVPSALPAAATRGRNCCFGKTADFALQGNHWPGPATWELCPCCHVRAAGVKGQSPRSVAICKMRHSVLQRQQPAERDEQAPLANIFQHACHET